MRAYILFNSKNKIPKWRKVLTFIFDQSFHSRQYCGFGRQYENGEISYDNYHWGKWEDNPNIPSIDSSTLWVIYPPLKEKISQLMLNKMAKHKFKRFAQLRMELNRPTLIDLRAFHRLVYLYAVSTTGLIFISKNKKLVGAHDYYQTYKEIIERPFNIHPTRKDLKRL